ncbi:MAG: hypothetical protein ACLU4N_24760 [Butyricimonas faecihominis]
MKWKMILFVLSLDIAFSACERKIFRYSPQMIPGSISNDKSTGRTRKCISIHWTFLSLPVQASIKDVILATVRTRWGRWRS